MAFYIANPDAIQLKQQQGYEWAKKFGTNRVSAKIYVDKIEELFSMHF